MANAMKKANVKTIKKNAKMAKSGKKQPNKSAAKQKEEVRKQLTKNLVRELQARQDKFDNKNVLDLALAMLEPALRGYAGQRHEFQETALKMVEKILEQIAHKMAEETATWNSAVAQDPAEIAALEAEKDQLKASLTQKMGQIKELETAKTQAQAAKKAAAENKKQSEEGLKAVLKEGAEKLKLSENVQKWAAEVMAPIAESGLDGKKEKTLSLLLKTVNCEASMALAVPNAMKKHPSERGTFDNLAVAQFTELFAAFAGELAAALDACPGLEQAAKETVAMAVSELEARGAELAATDAALKQANKEHDALEEEKGAQERQIKHMVKMAKRTAATAAQLSHEEELFTAVIADFRRFVADKADDTDEEEPVMLTIDLEGEEPAAPLEMEDAEMADSETCAVSGAEEGADEDAEEE